MEIGDTPSFDKVTKSEQCLYLSLLNLGPDAAWTLDLLEEAMALSPDPDRELETLFNEGWRHELVAGTAMLLCGATSASLESLWTAFDRGSWVSPQLSVIASVRDPGFIDKARRRLLTRCPIERGDRHSMAPLEAYVVHGPEGDRERSPKNFGALFERLWQLPEEREWLLSRFTCADVLRELFKNRDGETYAREWAQTMSTLRPLVSPPREEDIQELMTPWITPEAIRESRIPEEVFRCLLEYYDAHRVALKWLLKGREKIKLELQRDLSLRIGKELIPEPYGLKLFSHLADYPPRRAAKFRQEGPSLAIERHERITLTGDRLPGVDADLIAYGAKDTGEMGGGAANAILVAAGEEVLDALREGLAKSGREVGTAVVTDSFKIADNCGPQWISHIVSIKKHTPRGAWCPEPERLAGGVRKTMEEAERLNLFRVAFASLGTGEGRVPPKTAARLMIDTVRQYFSEHPENLLQVMFCLPTTRDYEAFEKHLHQARRH
ncbi:MAG: macro domain-containing protein [Candidatus Eremiobacteraeota bacterium]|nr:macro domain-containing protein [Candidatus Eremiobacteraeota bacterium]